MQEVVSTSAHGEGGARQSGVRLLVVLRGEPADALDAQKLAEGARPFAAAERGVEALRVEGALGAEDEGRYSIFRCLRRVLILSRLRQPLGVLLGLLHAEALLVQQLARVELAVEGAHYLGCRVDLAQERLHLVKLGVVQQVDLVHQQHVGKLRGGRAMSAGIAGASETRWIVQAQVRQGEECIPAVAPFLR